MELLFPILVFLAVLLFLLGLAALYGQGAALGAEHAARRMRGTMSEEARAAAIDIVRRDAMARDEWYAALFGRFAPMVALRRLLRQANSDMPISVFLLLSAVTGSGSALVGLLLGWPGLWTLGVGLAGLAAPWAYQQRQKTQRMKAIEAQLPDALDLIARTLQAGHAFIMGLKMVGEQMEDPIRSEFRKAFDEISFGVSVADAMKELSVRVDLIDIKFFVTSLLVQLETGGNLAEIIQGIASLIRARFELYGKVQTLSAEGRISALVMFVLPFGLGGALFVLNPKYMSLLFTDPSGLSMIRTSIAMMLAGLWVTRRMIAIKV